MRAKILLGTLVGFMGLLNAQNQVLTKVNGGTSWVTNGNGDITSVTAGSGLTGGGTTGAVTVTAAANNGLNVDATADRIQLGGALTEETTITHGSRDFTHNLDGTGDFHILDDGDDVFTIFSSGLVLVNNAGLGTVDFRVESDNNANMLFVDAGADAVGINDGTPDATLDVGGSFRLDGTFADKDGDVGTAGQILTSTATGTDWVSGPTSIGAFAYLDNLVINTANNNWNTLMVLDVGSEVFDFGSDLGASSFVIPEDGYYTVDYGFDVTATDVGTNAPVSGLVYLSGTRLGGAAIMSETTNTMDAGDRKKIIGSVSFYAETGEVITLRITVGIGTGAASTNRVDVLGGLDSYLRIKAF